MKHLLLILSFLLLSSPVIGQSSKYESVSQCVIQTMKERELTGNKMFEMVKEECERILGKVETGVKKRQKGVLFFREGNSGFGLYEDGDEKKDRWYVGEIENGEPNGQGTHTFPDGRKYVGESKDGQWDGQGTITYPDGRKYVGEFKDEEFHGKGTLTRPDGGKYVGEFKNGKIHGQGTYTFEKGKYEGFKYVGEWKDGTQQGQGTDSLPDGSNYVGEWKDGERWNGTLYDKEGKIIGKFMNGWFDQ